MHIMKIWPYRTLPAAEKQRLFQRARTDIAGVRDQVTDLVAKVRQRGDAAISEQMARFDRITLQPEQFRVSAAEIEQAVAGLAPATLAAIREQIGWSTRFHTAQKTEKQWLMELEQGVLAGQITRPLASVGLYVPGGRASYPSVAQILAVPAQVAGVPRICLFTPPGNMTAEVIAAAHLAGAHELYRIGGVAAVAAAAYGTQTVAPVDKIVGPGNIYVQAAKLAVFGQVAIDMPAGPSEVLIIADETARPEWCAADLLAQAEHDPDAAAVLVTHVPALAEATRQEVLRQTAAAPRREIIEQALQRYAAILLTADLAQSVAVANAYAAEHLQLMVADPFGLLPRVEHAGSVFLGHHAPVAVGDYASGVNHTLPTGAWARMFSPIGVETFQKKMEFEYLTPAGLARLKHIVYRLAAVEGLPAHGAAVGIRFGETGSGSDEHPPATAK